MSRDERVYLEDILDRCGRIMGFVEGMSEPDWSGDTRTQDAVLRNLEVIGEAVKRLPESMRAAHPDVQWKEIAGLRDVLIHEYEGIDLAIVWDIATNEVPALRDAVAAIMDAEEPLS